MNRQGLESLPKSLTQRPVTQATWRREVDSRTLALSRRRLDLLTSIRGDKANEPSERSLVVWHDEVIVAPGQSAKRAVGRVDSDRVFFFFFAGVLSCSYLIKLSLHSCFQWGFLTPCPLPVLQKAQAHLCFSSQGH